MDRPPVIIDPGSNTLKAGLPGDLPKVEVPSLIARPRVETHSMKFSGKNYTYVGRDAAGLRGAMRMHYPIEHGFVSNWDDYETLIWHTYHEELRIVPDDHPLLITEHPLNPKGNTEIIAQLAFESFNTPLLSVCNTSVLSLAAEELDTGLVIELGGGTFNISPIQDFNLLRQLTPKIPWSGSYITDLLRQLLLNESSHASADQRDDLKRNGLWQSLNDMKHKCCFVSQDYERDLSLDSSAHALNYELPDGSELKLTSERFIAPESIFKPELLGIEMYGLHRQASDYVNRADVDLKTKLLSNVVISGGCSLFPGLPERFKMEIESFSGQTVNVYASANRKFSAWIGGSNIAGLPFDAKQWASKEEYDEVGPTILFSKRFHEPVGC